MFSAMTNRGVVDLLTKVRQILEEMPPPTISYSKNLPTLNRSFNFHSSGFHIKLVPNKIEGRRAFAVVGRESKIVSEKMKFRGHSIDISKLQNILKNSGIIEKLKNA